VDEARPRATQAADAGRAKALATERNPSATGTGHVPDVRSVVEDAAVSVAPLRIARGSQNKILESIGN